MMQTQSVIPPKSPNDKRTYQAIILPNKLKLLLIHDDQIAKGACSISVGVGSLSDKDRSLGLAHFLQHMLFMGSNKFPSHNEYSSFISNNSGFDNAYTSDKETNYYFQIKNSALNEAVERLTNFFTGALLLQDCILKESQAVHEEFVLWTNNDNCRKWQVLRKLASGPYSRFSIGNVDTLRHQHIREDLVQFYNQYYSANIINAVVCSNSTIKEMKQNLLPLFQAIPNKEVEVPKFDQHFKQEQTGKFIQMQSIKDQVIMQFFWVVDYLLPLYKKHISDYITHVIGHEGQNSLLSILRFKNYASELSSYDHNLKSQTLIGLQIKLTEHGEENYEQVYNIVMDFMSTLRAQQYIYEQIRQRKLVEFQFKQKQDISDYVCRLSSKMHNLPLEQILNSSTIFQEFDSEAINKFLGQLNPFNVLIVYSSNQELQDAVTQKYLGARYKVQDLPTRDKSKVSIGPYLKNPFIPIDTKVHEFKKQSNTPIKIMDNVYFLQNSSFRVCKGGIYLRVFSEQSFQFLQFYSQYLEMLLKMILYPAQTLKCEITYDYDDCLTISVFGFSDTVTKVIQIIADSIDKVHDSEKSQIIFNVCLNNHIESYQNFYTMDTDQIGDSTLDIMLKKRQNTIQNTLKNLRDYSYQQTTQRIKRLWKNNRLNWIIVGNFQQQAIKNLVNNVQKKLHGVIQAKIPECGCLKLSQNVLHQIRLQSQQLSSSYSMVYYQAGPYTQELKYKLQLIKNYIAEPFFNELRTLKQMAYSLGVRIDHTRGVLGLKFYLISSTRDPQNISNEIKTYVNSFLGQMKDELLKQDEKSFKQIKQSVFTKIHAPHNNLNELYQFIVKQINKKTFYYNRKQQKQIRNHLDKIQVSDLEKTWIDLKNRTIDLFIVSKSHQEDYNKYNIKSTDIQTIKSNLGFWGDFQSCN